MTPPTVDRLAAETDRLLTFAEAAALPGEGFGWLDTHGNVDRAQSSQLWVTARMTHVFGLAHLLARPGADELVDHGLAAIRGPFHDHEHGGWFGTLGATDPGTQRKEAYPHAFVVLAAATATVAGRPGAAGLLDEALRVVEEHFWREEEGACGESWDRGWQVAEDYRGANANMHLTEAFLAAADATGDETWRGRALRICERLVDQGARDHGWRLPEHYDDTWEPLPDYNRDQPRHPFRPYGATPGHGMEWARLLLHLEAALTTPPPWLRPAAEALFRRAVEDGWVREAGGIVYTTDFAGEPVVTDRFHWVVAEGIAAAAALWQATARPEYRAAYGRFWDYADNHLLDRRHGSWWHELDETNQPQTRTWQGKPDIYHALQATLIPRLPLSPGLAVAIREGRLDTVDVNGPRGRVPSPRGRRGRG